MKNILVIFKKQLKDTFTNKAVLIQFVLDKIAEIRETMKENEEKEE